MIEFEEFSNQSDLRFWSLAQPELMRRLWNWRHPDTPAPEIVRWGEQTRVLRIDAPTQRQLAMPMAYCVYHENNLTQVISLLGPVPNSPATTHIWSACPQEPNGAADARAPLGAIMGMTGEILL